MVDTHGVRTVRVTGRFLTGMLDGPDAGVEPDSVPLDGARVRLTPTPTVNELHMDSPPSTLILDTFEVITAADGSVTNPDTGDAEVRLPADYPSPDGVRRIKWKSEVLGTGGGAIITKEWVVPLDATAVDLTTVEPLPGSFVINLSAWEELVASARAAKDVAFASAQAAANDRALAVAAKVDAQTARDEALSHAELFVAPAKGVMDSIMGGDVAGLVPVAENATTGVRELGFNANHPDFSATTQKQRILNAMTAATASGYGRPVILPPGVWEVGDGLSMAGQTCTLEGAGGGTVQKSPGISTPGGVAIKASTQAGPVLDFEGYIWPRDHRGALSFGNFLIEGSGVADPTKSNSGMRVGNTGPGGSAGGALWHDIVIQKTGGPCLDLTRVYLCEFDRLTLVTPVAAGTHNVPYLHGKGVNCTTFDRLGLRSILYYPGNDFAVNNDCGVDGAILFTDDGEWDSYGSTFNDMWFENLHVPTNGCVMKLKANRTAINDPSTSDVRPEPGATNTAHFRFESSAVRNEGGNMFRGMMPGAVPELPDTWFLTYGAVVSQPGNNFTGVKGKNGHNIKLLPNSSGTFVHFGGTQNKAANLPAVIDESGASSPTHTLIDEYMGVAQHRGYRLKERGYTARAGVIVENVATPTDGAVYLGSEHKAGVAGVNNGLKLVGETISLNNPSNLSAMMGLTLGGSVASPMVIPHAGNPEGALSAPRGSICLRIDGSAQETLYVKETGSGSTGWVGR